MTLKAPGLRELYLVFSSGVVPHPNHRRAEFDDLALRLQPLDEADGWHAVGWYLYWLMNVLYPVQTTVDRPQTSVLTHYNRIFSEKTETMFRQAMPVDGISCYSMLLSNPRNMFRLDTYCLLRYDLMLRHNYVAEASDLIGKRLLPILNEFLGLPHIRLALSEETETLLWTRVLSLCACSTRL